MGQQANSTEEFIDFINELFLFTPDTGYKENEKRIKEIKDFIEGHTYVELLSLVNGETTLAYGGCSSFGYIASSYPEMFIPVVEVVENKLLHYFSPEEVNELILGNLKKTDNFKRSALSILASDPKRQTEYKFIFNKFIQQTIQDTSNLFKRNLLSPKDNG